MYVLYSVYPLCSLFRLRIQTGYKPIVLMPSEFGIIICIGASMLFKLRIRKLCSQC